MLRTRIMLIGAAFVLAAGVGAAFGQAGYAVLTTLTGSELIRVDNGGPLLNAVATNTLRNTTGYQISAAASGTITTTVSTDNLLLTAALTGAATVDLPPSPPDGQLFSINNATASAFTAAITATTTDGATINNGSSVGDLAANSSAEFQYNASGNKWYRLR